MKTTIKLNIPTGSIAGWRAALERAKDIYWQTRRDGKNENEALSAALDDALADQEAASL